MDPISASAVATVAIPFITAAIKKLFTKKLPDNVQPGINTVLPLVLGMVSAGLYTYTQTHNVWGAVAAGLGAGGVASSARDLDKNLLGIVASVYKLAGKK
jgi:Kef-type K+ transport system membrane component KefB